MIAVDGSMTWSTPPPHPCEKTLFFPASDANGDPVKFRYLRFIAKTYFMFGATLSFFGPRVVGKITKCYTHATCYTTIKAYLLHTKILKHCFRVQ